LYCLPNFRTFLLIIDAPFKRLLVESPQEALILCRAAGTRYRSGFLHVKT